MQFIYLHLSKNIAKKNYRKLNFEKDFLRFPGDSAACKKNGLDEWLIKKIWNWLFSHFQEEVYWEGPADSADSVSICWGLDDVAPKTRRKLKDQNSCWKTTNISSNNHSTRNMSFYFRKENCLDFSYNFILSLQDLIIIIWRCNILEFTHTGIQGNIMQCT